MPGWGAVCITRPLRKKRLIEMEDRRIRKTKTAVKQALVRLLGEKTFDQITVTTLCEAADISRITFYTHYGDKYELAEDLFQDLLRVAVEDFNRLQRENNPEDDARKGYCNLLDCILNLFESNTRFLRQMSQRRNPYLYYSFYNYVFQKVEQLVERTGRKLVQRFGSKQFAAFICNGLWAYIDKCYEENYSLARIREESQALLEGVLQSMIAISPA